MSKILCSTERLSRYKITINGITYISLLQMFRVIYFNRTIKSTLLYILLLLIINITNVASQCGTTGTSTDRQDKLAIYKVILRTYWSRARFPRHYPEWRPPAQFGKLVGKFFFFLNIQLLAQSSN